MNAEVIDSHGLISTGANYQRVARYSKPGLSPGKAVSEVVSCGVRLSVVGHAEIRKPQVE